MKRDDFECPEIPDRPDLKQGGHGEERWIEIDFYWERAGFCMLLDQPERHSPYTRQLDLARDDILRGLGLEVVRFDRDDLDAGRVDLIHERLHSLRHRRCRIYVPPMSPWDSRSERRRRPIEPLANVTRTIAWLAGDPNAPAIPPEWPRHYDRDLVTWNFRPAGDALVGPM